jgi:AcrR family transcriptional regulator
MTKLRNMDQLIEVASRLLVEKGADSLNFDDIAADLGMHRSSLYYYVQNKTELLNLVEIHRQGLIAEELARIAQSNDSSRTRLLSAIRAHLRHTDRFFPESRTWNRIDPNPYIDEKRSDHGSLVNRGIVECFRSIIEDGVTAGEFACMGEPKVLAFAILGMCNWVPRWYRKGGRLSIDEISEMFVGLIEAGLLRRPVDDRHDVAPA